MGEVYKARDPRLGRDVAVKVLPAAFAADDERLKRFEQEARAAGGLDHPNVLSLHDLGTYEGAPYLVFELLEGETLRRRLRDGALSAGKTIEYGAQIASGLAAAHAKGIIHRDLKPENLFVTTEGRVKILDFGLAKLRPAPGRAASGSEVATVSAVTDAGTVLGTTRYMSPEQAQGLPVDHRSDVFALGSILYEALTGEPAFRGETSASTLAAILRDEPPELLSTSGRIPPGLERILKHCLEKRPEHRFHSAHDLGLALEAVSGSTSRQAPLPPRPWIRPRTAMLAAVLLGATAAASLLIGRRLATHSSPIYRQLTYRRGILDSARFAADGQTIVFSARWEDRASEVFTTRLDLAEAPALSLSQNAHLDAQHGGEVLIHYADGRLARMPLLGGTPRDVGEDVSESDWGSTGDIAVVRRQSVPKRRSWLEYPVGKVLVESSLDRPLGEPRISPEGDRVAFVSGRHGANGGDVVVVDRNGSRSILSSGWMELEGLAWSPDGREVWFTAGGSADGGPGAWGTLKELRGVSLAGRERLLLRMAGDLTLEDVFRDGRVLVSHGRTRVEARGKLAGDEKERDLTYLDGTYPVGISDDGRSLLFQEAAQAGGPKSTAYLRRVGDSTPIRLGEGWAMSLSPDGRRAITGMGYRQGNAGLMLVSAGTDTPRELPRGPIERMGWGWWTSDGRHVIFDGCEKDETCRSYIQDLSDRPPRPISREGTLCDPVPGPGWVPCRHNESNDGRTVRVWELHSLDDGTVRPVPWIGPEEVFVAGSADGHHAYVVGEYPPPFRVFRVDTSTGRREPWLDVAPADLAGINRGAGVRRTLTPDGRYYAYAYLRTQSDLFLIEGLR